MQQHKLDIGYGLGVLAVALALMLLWPGLLQNLLVANGFIPHGHCYLWKPELVWLHLTSDTLIGLAYVSISSTLAYLVYKSRQDIPFHWMFLGFGTFIVACGATHFMEVWTVWTPTYWLAGQIKLLTAVASVTTAVMLPQLVPQALSLVEAAKASEERKLHLETANQELETVYQKLKELDEIKTQFFANVSHELRTPLALILGPAEKLLRADALTEAQRQDLKVVNRNAKTLLKHVNDLLDISKLEAGKMQANYAEVDLAQLVRLTASHFETLAHDRQISFLVDTPESVPAQLDPDKLQRICLNLLSNAFKFTPAGGSVRCILAKEQRCRGAGEAEVQGSRGAEETSNTNLPSATLPLERAIITVQDSGFGVPPTLREVIFEPFRQGEETATRRFGGTGLGLAIVKEFVDLHGGTITVSDAPEGGALFAIELPLTAPTGVAVRKRATESKDMEEIPPQLISEFTATDNSVSADFVDNLRATTDISTPPTATTQNSVRAGEADESGVETEQSFNITPPTTQNYPLVLVVEDNPEMNRFITQALADEYRTANAFNGQEGLEKALSLRPDLILSDLMMPQLSGDQLVREVRKHPELDAIPIVLLTAKADDALRVRLLREGVQDYLSKPFPTEELRSRVGNLIAMKKAREVLQQELDSKSQDLAALASELADRNRELNILASKLEIRVQERTAELKAANELLKQEIAERQQAEEDLQKEQEFLKAVLDNVEAGIVACDANGVLTIFNRVTREFHGLPEQPLSANEWAKYYDLYMPDGKTPMKQKDIPLWRALQGERFHNVEMTIAPKQGSNRTLLASGQAIVNPQGRKLGAVAVMHDITQRKQAEEERAQLIREQMARAEAEASKWRFAFLAETRMVLSSSLDYETTLPGVASLAVPSLADYCLIDLIDKGDSIRRVESVHIDPAKEALMSFLARNYPPDPHGLLGITKVLHSGESELIEEVTDWQLEACAPDEEQLEAMRQLNPVSAMIVPLSTGGRTLGVISLLSAESGRHYDQTDLALAEDLAHSIALAVENARLYRDAQEANRMKDEFLAVLSHELRTPLNSMLGWVTLLRTRKFDEAKTAKALETIERNARSQFQMIEELLDVSRIIRGKLQLNIRQVDLIPVIEAAIDTLRPAAEAKGMAIESVLDISVGSVSGDSDRLQQVVWNLVSNAIKFTPSTGRVEVRLTRVDDYAQIQVRDTGKGISPEFLPYVFERFRQENSSITRSHGGLGLGLAIVRHLVELHGGTVRAESAGIDLGATFIVRLPLPENSRVNSDRQMRWKTGEDSPIIPSPSHPLQGLRLLVVDDEADTREVITTMLEQCGAEVIGVDSVRQALAAINQQLPDVLISDIGMPVEDGYSLIRQLRQQEPKSGKHLPAIALTAYAREEDREQALAAGFQMHVSKPVEPNNLTQAIASLVNRKIN
ncbi:MAG: response regulator [Aphanothece sp. CMT-3BRIN-NPC111]|jgi:PAS domain S-box-containing protein|nr:response regulator [Aphanothece sp. CMT-3BRIN-NPC111]